MAIDPQLLLTYGPLGLWTTYLLYEKHKMFTRWTDALREHNKMLSKLVNYLNGK